MYYLSYPLSEKTPCFGGKPGFSREKRGQIAKGDSSNTQEWFVQNHAGTHIDLPFHFDNNGKKIEDFPKVEDWVFHTPFVAEIDASPDELIKPDRFIQEIPHDADMLIVKTGWFKKREKSEYWKHNPGFAPETGTWLRKNCPELKIIGFDFISLSAWQHRAVGQEAHRAFLAVDGPGEPLRIIEDLDLSKLNATPKRILVFPWQITECGGAPVTVVADE